VKMFGREEGWVWGDGGRGNSGGRKGVFEREGEGGLGSKERETNSGTEGERVEECGCWSLLCCAWIWADLFERRNDLQIWYAASWSGDEYWNVAEE